MIQNLAKFIPVEGEPMLLELVSRIEKLRALQDDESILVERIIKRERDRSGVRIKKRIWTKTEKDNLLKASKVKGGVKKFACVHNMEERTAWHMLRNLRNGITKRPQVKG